MPHGDLAVAVDAGGQQQPGLERLVRQRDQQGRLGGEVLADGADPRPDPAGVLGLPGRGDPRVQLRQGVHFRDRDQVVAAEVADLALDAAFLVRSVDAGLAVERRRTGSATGTPSTAGSRSAPGPSQHPGHGRASGCRTGSARPGHRPGRRTRARGLPGTPPARRSPTPGGRPCRNTTSGTRTGST